MVYGDTTNSETWQIVWAIMSETWPGRIENSRLPRNPWCDPSNRSASGSRPIDTHTPNPSSCPDAPSCLSYTSSRPGIRPGFCSESDHSCFRTTHRSPFSKFLCFPKTNHRWRWQLSCALNRWSPETLHLNKPAHISLILSDLYSYKDQCVVF